MSASVRPSIPRPSSKPSTAPAAPTSVNPPRPTASVPPPPASGPTLAKTSVAPPATTPAPVRERLATLDLDDGDIVGVAVAPIKSTPPPAPRKTSMPPAAPVSVRPAAPAAPAAMKSSIPPAPQSSVVASKVSVPVPSGAKMPTPGLAFTPPRVPTFDDPISVDVEMPASVRAPVAVPAPVVVAAPVSQPPSTLPAPVSVAPPPASIPAPAPVSVAPPASIPAPAPVARVMTPMAFAPQPAPHVPPPAKSGTSVSRLSINDPTDLIFDGMYGLTFAKSTGEAAEMCAETLARALGARAVVIHTHDLMSRELRAIGAHGDGDFDIIGSAEASEDDMVASAVICNQKSVTMKFDGELPRLAPKRLHAVGAPRTLVAAPAMAWGRCLAIIEVIDADERFATRVADSAAYVAEHFAQFLSGAHAA